MLLLNSGLLLAVLDMGFQTWRALRTSAGAAALCLLKMGCESATPGRELGLAVSIAAHSVRSDSRRGVLNRVLCSPET